MAKGGGQRGGIRPTFLLILGRLTGAGWGGKRGPKRPGPDAVFGASMRLAGMKKGAVSAPFSDENRLELDVRMCRVSNPIGTRFRPLSRAS